MISDLFLQRNERFRPVTILHFYKYVIYPTSRLKMKGSDDHTFSFLKSI